MNYHFTEIQHEISIFKLRIVLLTENILVQGYVKHHSVEKRGLWIKFQGFNVQQNSYETHSWANQKMWSLLYSLLRWKVVFFRFYNIRIQYIWSAKDNRNERASVIFIVDFWSLFTPSWVFLLSHIFNIYVPVGTCAMKHYHALVHASEKEPFSWFSITKSIRVLWCAALAK